jgi:endonuclease/exonuclease/phosphatase (EEP) superfamily protein YafD
MIHKPSTSTQRIVITVSLTYSLLVVLWLCLRWLFFDRFWPLAIINTTIFYFFVPLPILILITIYQRQKWAMTALLIPLFIFLSFWGNLFLPSASTTVEPAQEIKAMSYNVLFSNKTPDALAISIISASPDIIGFQELRPEIINSQKSNLSTTYLYHTFDMFEPRGVGLLSRYPIIEAVKFPFPPRNRLALHAAIDWDGQPVHVFVVHLSANNFFDNPLSQLPRLARERYGQRAGQITRLEEELSMIDEPVILMCDCNLTDTSEAYFRLKQILNDSYRSVGWGFGHTLHPPDLPFRVQRIDYVWHSDDFTPTHSYVGSAGGSDHHPVISTLGFTGQE